jgi:hypothetical protein
MINVLKFPSKIKDDIDAEEMLRSIADNGCKRAIVINIGDDNEATFHCSFTNLGEILLYIERFKFFLHQNGYL